MFARDIGASKINWGFNSLEGVLEGNSPAKIHANFLRAVSSLV